MSGYLNGPGSGAYTGGSGSGAPPLDSGNGSYTGGPAPVQQDDQLHGPGSDSFDVTDPQQSVEQAAQQTGDMFGGLKHFLFGTDQGDATGKHGGLLNIGDVPIVGNLLRGGADVIGGVGGAAVGAVVNTLGGAAERIPTDNSNALGLQQQFDAIPDDSPAKQAALAQMQKDTGLFGTGALSGKEHYMSLAIQQHEDEQVQKNPNLWSGLFRPAASLSDTVSNMFGALGAGQRLVERGIAGAGRSASDNHWNQLQMVMAVGDGNAVWTQDDPGLSPVEKTVYDQVKSHQWTDEQALDFLASHGAGLSHDKRLEIAGTFATDPLNLALPFSAAAKLGESGALLLKTLKGAQELLKTAQAEGDVAKIAEATKAVETAQQGIKTGEAAAGARKFDVLGQVAKQPIIGKAARQYGRLYGTLDGNPLGKAAKIIRTVVDPMHAMGSNPRGMASVEEGSREVTQAVVNAHDEFAHIDNIRFLQGLDGGDELADAYNEGMAIYSGNVFRRVAGRQFRAVQMMMGSSHVAELVNTKPMAAMKGAVAGMKRRGLVQLEEEAGKFVKSIWSKDDDINLAARAATLWGGRKAEEWLPDIAKMSGKQKSLLHAATYGSAVKQLHTALAADKAAGAYLSLAKGDWSKIVLLNRRTLTQLGHEGILDQLEHAGDSAAKIAVIESARATYPELQSFAIDRTSDSETINDFLDMMERRKHFLPSQIRNEERPELPEALREFDAKITPNADPEQAVFTIGFRPDDGFLWGISPDSDGVLREAHDPWMDQASDVFGAYSPVREVPRNIAGMPILGALAEKGAAALDFSEAVGRMAMHGVTGKMVSQAAHIKFVEQVASKYVTEDGTPLLTKGTVEKVWSALMKKVDDTDNISGMRGLSENAIWDAAKAVIPKSVENAGLGRRELMLHVLDAYDGDMRYIGLTQKLSSKSKALLGRTFVGNTAGQIAENAWPLLKFRLNPFFQLQEKIEPWVLSATRGAKVAFGTKTEAVDRQTAAVFRNFAEHDLVNIADNDIGELAGKYLWAKKLTQASDQEGGRLDRFANAAKGAFDVQGTKQLAMLRTFKKGVSRDFRAAMEEADPGKFDQMLDHARALKGEAIDADDFVIDMIHSNLAANDLPIEMIDGKPTLKFDNAIHEAQWSAPQTLGELRQINLDYVARRLALRDTTGASLETSMDLRRALADNRLTHDDIQRGLRELHAHPDYRARVKSALSFSHGEFFRQVQETYGLTTAQRLHVEGVFQRIADRRGMTPVEYMSQVWSPMIGRGTDHAVGSLGALVSTVKDGLPSPDLGQLRGIAGQSTISDFYRQAGAIMSNHLDPSAKRSILLDMMDPTGNDPIIRQRAARGEILTDMHEIDDAFASGGEDALSNRIMHFLQGQPGTGPHDLVADEATGVKAIRDAATELRASGGRPRNMQRFVSHDSPEVQQQLADALDAMPEEYEHVATPADLAQKVDMAEVNRFKNIRTAGHVKDSLGDVPASSRAAFEARMLETRQLYSKVTKPRAEGGLGIRVIQSSAAEPYRSADAMRADLAAGKIKVPAAGYWHPVLHNEDMFMERVVSDVFGHGQEKNVLNSHDALMNASAMYSDEARASYLTDGFARTSWERASQQVIPQAVAEPTTVAEYNARYGAAADRVEDVATRGIGPDGMSVRKQSRNLGVNLLAAPEEVQTEAITHLGSLRNQFPGAQLDAFDFGNVPADGVVLEYDLEHPTMVLNTQSGWQADATVRANTRANRLRVADHNTQTSAPRLDQFQQPIPRQAFDNVPQFTSASPVGDLYHEFGHVVDAFLHRRRGAMATENYGSARLSKFMANFKGSDAHKMLSDYAFNPTGKFPLDDSDMFAELFDMSFNPEQAETLEQAYGTPLGDAVNQFRGILKDEGVWHPDGVGVPVNPHAGKTIAEANAAGAGIRAPFKRGVLPQEALDAATQHFIGSGRYAESNPDVGRMAAYLRDHMTDVVGDALERDTASPTAHFLNATSGIPVTDSTPFNMTEAVMWHSAASMMAAKWEDAYRLQYFAQNRSWLQRSINHPMFGLYPASYMWGKIGPEMVRFIAKEPFGMRTGAMGYSLADIQRAVAVQRKYDPDMEKSINDLGHSAALSFLGYMLPATPWDIPASYPSWMRNMAEQGLTNEAQAENGGIVNDDDFVNPLLDSWKKLTPLQTQLPFASRAAGELGNSLPWNQKTAAPQTYDPSGRIPTTDDIQPTSVQPTSKPIAAPTESAPTTGYTGEPLTASGLTAVLVPDTQSLMDALSGV